MKCSLRKRLILFAVFLLCLGKLFATPITIEEAKQAIKNWAGRQNLNIEYFDSMGVYPGCAAFGIMECYRFSVDDPNPDKRYSGYITIDQFSGAVVELEDLGVIWELADRDEESKTIANMIPPQQAIQLAEGVIRSYFPNIPIESLYIETDPDRTPDVASWLEFNDVITVVFLNRTFNPSGEEVWLPIQSACAQFAFDTGELYRVTAVWEDLTISPTPTISKEEALQIGISYLYGLGASYVEVHTPPTGWYVGRAPGGGPQRLNTGMTAFADDAIHPGKLMMWWLTIDGHTGEVWDVQQSLGGPPLQKKKAITLVFNGRAQKWKMNPVVKNGEIYISLDDIKAMGFKVAKSGKNYVISFKKEKASVSGSEILWIKGKPFIRSSSLGKIKGIKVKHLKEFKVLNIWVMNEKGYSQGKKEALRLKNQRREQQ